MAIKSICPHCQQVYSLADTQRGKKVRCKSCDELFVIGESETAAKSSPRPRDEEEERPAPRKPRAKKSGKPAWIWIVGGIAAAVLLLSCLGGGFALMWVYGPLGNKVTEENYGKIKIGMTEAQVKAILGDPTETDATIRQLGRLGGINPKALGAQIAIWKHGQDDITIIYQNGKVAFVKLQLMFPGGGYKMLSKNSN